MNIRGNMHEPAEASVKNGPTPLADYLDADTWTVASQVAVCGIFLIALVATRMKAVTPRDKVANALTSPRNMQIAMLVEAVMLGYTLARKSGGKSLR